MPQQSIDTLFLDDLVAVAKSGLSDELEKWCAKALNDDKVYALGYVVTSIWKPFDPDYEAAKDLIREVVSAQDQEAPTP